MIWNRLLAALALSIVCMTGAVNAAQALPTEVTSSGSSPVRIDSCRAALLDKPGPGSLLVSALTTKRNYYIAAAVDFTNISPQPVNAVRIVFDVQDTFNAVTQSFGLDSIGTYSPGVQIHARQNLAGTVGQSIKKTRRRRPRM